MDANMLTVGGRLTKDATQKAVGNYKLTTFDIANNTGFGDKKKTNYFTVNMWGTQGDNVFQYLKKGQGVIVSGELNVNNWQGNDGSQHTQLQIESKQFVLNGSNPNNSSTAVPEPEMSPSF